MNNIIQKILQAREWVRTQFHGKLYYLTFNKEQIELCNKAEDMNSLIQELTDKLDTTWNERNPNIRLEDVLGDLKGMVDRNLLK